MKDSANETHTQHCNVLFFKLGKIVVKTDSKVMFLPLCPHTSKKCSSGNVAGTKCEMHQVPQMGPREYRPRVPAVRAVGYQRQLHGLGGGSR